MLYGSSSFVSMLPTDLKKLILSFVEVCEDCRKVFIITPYVNETCWTNGCCGDSKNCYLKGITRCPLCEWEILEKTWEGPMCYVCASKWKHDQWD